MGADGAAELLPGVTALVRRHTVGLRRSGPYRPPSEDEVGRLSALADALVTADPDALASAAATVGLRVSEHDGRLMLVPPAPGLAPWLLLGVMPRVAPRALVEVPHPYADLHTESAALALVARRPDAVLLQAGVHRVAAGPGGVRDRAAYPADVAARPDAAFSRLAEGLVARLGVVQVQWHGFADRHDRADVDVVASPGAASPGPVLDAVVSRLVACGLRVLGPDEPRVAALAGRRNVQGLAAARHGAPFVHLELSRTVRDDPARLEAVAEAVAGALAATDHR